MDISSFQSELNSAVQQSSHSSEEGVQIPNAIPDFSSCIPSVNPVSFSSPESCSSVSNTTLTASRKRRAPGLHPPLQNARSSFPSCDFGKKTVKQAPKRRRYDRAYLQYGFTYTIKDGKQLPKCVICSDVLANESMKPSKLKRHLVSRHQQYVDKSIEFFESRLLSQNESEPLVAEERKQLDASTLRALKACYLISLRIAKNKKSHSVAESLILPAMIEISEILFGSDVAEKLQSIPLSDSAVSSCILDMSLDVENQLCNKVRESSVFSLQIDVATDLSNMKQMVVYVRYLWNTEILEDFLLCEELPQESTGEEMFQVLDTYLKIHGISWQRCIGLCSDGACESSGMNSNLISLIRNVAPDVIWTHCFLHREYLVPGQFFPELNEVVQVVIKIINLIKTKPLNSGLFSFFSQSIDSEKGGLLLHSEVRWLSQDVILKGVFQMREEIASFFESIEPELSNLLKDREFVLKLAYVTDIFCELNKSIHGQGSYIFDLVDRVTALQKKMLRWKQRIEEGVCCMFPSLEEVIESKEVLQSSKIKDIIISHLTYLDDSFTKYFQESVEKITHHRKWIQNPFSCANGTAELGLEPSEEDMLIDIACSSFYQARFEFYEKDIFKFWTSLSTLYSALAQRGLKMMLLFATTYLCDHGFSVLATLKGKLYTYYNVAPDMRLALTSQMPRIDLLCMLRGECGNVGGVVASEN